MNKYRLMVEEISGKKYDLYHVKQNNLQLGGFSYRPRYFWVAVRKGMPFGAQVVEPKELPRIMDIIGDLAKLPQQWEEQKYIEKHSKFTKYLRSQNGKVNGHIGKNTVHAQRIQEVFDLIGNEGWEGNGDLGGALKKAVEANDGKFPQRWVDISPRVIRKNYKLGFSQPYRWKEDHWCNVLTGSALDHVVHPTEPRLLTHRECARMQGCLMTGTLKAQRIILRCKLRGERQSQCKLLSGLEMPWLPHLSGEPNGPQGELIGDREWLIDTDKGFSRHAAKKRYE
jgi:site-specific DNA-cytosine methylase